MLCRANEWYRLEPPHADPVLCNLRDNVELDFEPEGIILMVQTNHDVTHVMVVVRFLTNWQHNNDYCNWPSSSGSDSV